MPTLTNRIPFPRGPIHGPVSLALFLLLLLGFPAPPRAAHAADPDGETPSAPIEPWTVDELLRLPQVRDLALSRDGRRAAWVVREWRKVGEENKRLGHIWLARLDATGERAEPIQLTRGITDDSSPAFSPDGRHLAFLTRREQPGKKKVEGPQVWILPTAGGEPWALTSFRRGVRFAGWIDDTRLLLARPEDEDARELRREKAKDTSLAVEDPRDAPPVRLFVVSLGGESRRLTTNGDWIEQVAISPDGSKAAITAGQSLSYTFDSKVPPKTFLVDLRSGERTEILAGTRLLPRNLRFSPDSRHLYFLDDFTNHPLYRNATVARLHRYELASSAVTEIDLGWPRGVGNGFEAVPGGVVTLLADGTRYRAAHIAIRGENAVRRELEGTHGAHLDRLVVSSSGTHALYLSSTADRPHRLYAAGLDGLAGTEDAETTPVRLVDEKRLHQPTLAPKPEGRTEIVRWTGALGDEVEGVLSYPFDYVPGRAYPMVLDIHGGPTGYDRDSWDGNWASPTPLWRQRGAFVFRVNYHGSGNYGLEWAESIRERYYELEIPDIESGVDRLIERGLVDPQRLATTGWSNGGILSAGLITHTDRYRAAIIGAADVEWISDWANVDFGASFDNYYFGGPPWERLDHYIEKSPFFQLPEVTTPSLVHTGTEDRNVPPHQSWSIFRVMQQVGKAEVRLLLYPGEPHGLRQLEHQRRKVEEDLAWLDRHLFGTHEEIDPSIPEGSPLAVQLAAAGAAAVEGAYGHDHRGNLVPETVPYAGLIVARFELTRAQWHAFELARGNTGRPAPTAAERNLPA
ncbi:MAG: S9 family peptidase, partial [Holophagales bacterium]|nr:S9 family peptidase [Holophagales bacterium]